MQQLAWIVAMANKIKSTKQKTHKGTKKRFRLTASGKAMHRQAGTSHLAARMSHKRKRNLRGTAPVSKSMEPMIQQALNGHSY
jgi:large subunit ribosomal protein L35